jgi:hypothetical protein
MTFDTGQMIAVAAMLPLFHFDVQRWLTERLLWRS